MKKSFSLILLLFLTLGAYSQSKLIYDDKYAGGQYSAISNNGRFVVGYNATNTVIYLVDTKTGELTTIQDDGKYLCANDVSDDGKIIVGKFFDPTAEVVYKDQNKQDSIGYGTIVPGIYKNGKWIAVERTPALNGDGWDGSVNTISANGKLMGGTLPYYDSVTGTVSFTKYEPVIWGEDGKISKRLPIYTSEQGAAILAMSDDGNVACGWYNGSQYGRNIIWINGERVDTLNFKGYGYSVSANGKFVGGGCGKGMEAPHSKPYLWSADKGYIPVDCPKGTTYGYVMGISDEGRAVGLVDLGAMTQDRHPFIVENGVYHDFDTWIKENYNLTFPHGSFWAIQSISADGNVICGIGYYDGARDPWIVVLDESKLPDITSISTVKQELDVNVTFDAASRVLNIDGEYTSASLYNNVGTCVLTDNQAEGTMNVSQLATGIYFAKVTKGKVARTFKIAITH